MREQFTENNIHGLWPKITMSFYLSSESKVKKVILLSPGKSCVRLTLESDPLPTTLLKETIEELLPKKVVRILLIKSEWGTKSQEL